jgi:hypothetical protein
MANGMVVRAFALAACGLVAGIAAASTAGCSGDDASGVGKSKLPEGVRSGAIEHEACDESSGKVEVVDVNNDGRPDIKRVYRAGREVCRITDLNRDGKPDMFEYYDPNGQLRRREADYDDNGIVNAIEHYENGKLVRRELDTTNQGRIDTWDTFDPATGRRIKRERDATGDGRIDQWWSYEGDKVTIAMDRNGDGRPNPDATIVLGGQGSEAAPVAAAEPPPPEPPAPPPSPDDGPRIDVPDAGVVGDPKRGGAKR